MHGWGKIDVICKYDINTVAFSSLIMHFMDMKGMLRE